MPTTTNRPIGPLVSIGLHVRNGSDYIREALDSLLSQTYANYELIISDNASADDTRTICEEYTKKDKRIRYVRQEKNLGGYGNFDFVRNAARGEYFMLASHDDIWDSRFIEKCLMKFGEAPDAILTAVDFVAFRNSTPKGLMDKIWLNAPRNFSFPRDTYKRMKEYVLCRTSKGKIQIFIYGLWKKSVFRPQDKAEEYKTDADFLFKMLLRGYVAYSGEVLFFSRYGNRSANKDVRGFKANTKRILLSVLAIYTDRVWAILSPCALRQCRYIVASPNLKKNEKVRLIIWECYAYLRSIWYGHA